MGDWLRTASWKENYEGMEKKDINKIALEWFVSRTWRDSNSLKILQAEIKEKAEKLSKAILKLQTDVWKVRK